MKYIIYKIQIKDYIYIGSTKNFIQRKAEHKRKCNAGKDLIVYRTIRENGGWDCCTMVPVKEIEVETKRHAEIVEEEIRVEYNAQMNTNRAYQTIEERKEQIKQHKQTPEYKQHQKEYQQTPEYKEYKKQYRLAKKAKLAESLEIKVEG